MPSTPRGSPGKQTPSRPIPRSARALVVIGGAAAVLLVAGTAYINSGLISRATPAPSVTVAKTGVGCVSPAIALTGAITGCAGVLEAMNCPRGSLDATRVVHLRGSGNDYILYVEIDGGYQGPGTYKLTPWKKDTLNAGDGAAKVAIREWAGRLWESFSGSVTIDTSEEGGQVEADLLLPDKTSSPILHIEGPWTCP